ncbi:hypothetical protein HPB51_026403 [Rhipicephalus microplus]|uniref:Uncharacterized protein n=1 Tax=Rhipicephalus microplus TaxID=6941 RepID=A0A9J6D3S3_RHIMP|nr:hypothetical protein HPB51_026403 [Rhipicephalus microplus]
MTYLAPLQHLRQGERVAARSYGCTYVRRYTRDPTSLVYGGLHKGVFEGSIQSRWGRFYVEGARKFFARRTPFHSVMYAAEDAGIPQQGWCGVNGETTRWMQQLAVASERARNTEFKVRITDMYIRGEASTVSKTSDRCRRG